MRKIFASIVAVLGLFVGGLAVAPAAHAAPVAAAGSVAVMAKAKGNGCSYSPDSWGKAKFKAACNKYDYCYSPKSKTNRLNCDKALRTNLRKACAAAYPVNTAWRKVKNGAQRISCEAAAQTYYQAVRKAGKHFYNGKGKNN